MPRPRSSYSDTSDGEMDGNNEAELQRLSKQYRVMQNDRKAYCLEAQEAIKKQKEEIARLQAEQDEILKSLRLIESRSNQSTDDKNCENLGELGREKKDIEQQIKEEKQKHEELNAEQREWDKKKREQSRQQGGGSASGEHNTKTQKDVRKLENKLQLAENKFSGVLGENKDLRTEIDSLRRERRRFEEMYKKLDKERQKLNEEIGDIIEQATTAHDQRDEAQAKMILLKEKSDKDLQQHNTEMKELIRIIDHDKKLRMFMQTKCKERGEDPQLVKWRQEREAQMAEKMKASQTDSVETYEEAFGRIKEMRGEEDVDKIVDDFIQVEDRNFALFNFVNEQNNQLETLQEQIADINAEIERFKEQGVDLEEQRKSILIKLDHQQRGAAEKANEYDQKYTEVSKILDQLRAGIESLFGKISCDPNNIDEMLGSQQGVSNQNMIQYLGIVEERTNFLLMLQTYINNKQEEDSYLKKQPVLLGDGPQPQTQAPHMMPPTVGDEYDSEGSIGSDDASRPLTRGELTSKAMKSVKKREKDMNKQEFRYDLSEVKTKKKDKKGKY